MKWKRVLSFTKRNIYKGEANDGDSIYSSVGDEILTLRALEKAKKYGCRILNFKIGGALTSYCEISVLATQDSFLGFVNDYINDFRGYLENIEF